MALYIAERLRKLFLVGSATTRGRVNVHVGMSARNSVTVLETPSIFRPSASVVLKSSLPILNSKEVKLPIFVPKTVTLRMRRSSQSFRPTSSRVALTTKSALLGDTMSASLGIPIKLNSPGHATWNFSLSVFVNSGSKADEEPAFTTPAPRRDVDARFEGSTSSVGSGEACRPLATAAAETDRTRNIFEAKRAEPTANTN
mmetsp:Transcript_52335/g.119634  ORF Transcript_52335/g.119634 Transcript_52335/m.119634 type:complete len:200 (-) Transcript_52335:29-628(-)